MRSWFRGHPQPGDVLFVCKGTPGRVAVVPDPVPFCIAQDMVALRADPSVIDSGYLYYLLSQDSTRQAIETMHVGTLIPHFKKGDFPRLKLRHHRSIKEQRAIAEVLGALDDKIAANARMHEIADELATALWRRISSMSETSHLTYAQVAEIGGGGTPSTREPSFWGGNVRWASPTDITALDAPYLDRTSKGLTAEGLAACSSALYPARSVLMTSRATIGSFAMAMEPTAVNQGFIVARAREPLGTWWLFHEMRSRVADYVSHANGATFLELPRGRFKGLEVRWPGDEALTKFDAQAQPLHARAYSAMVENRKLAELRDALLPELMSGRLRVKDAEKSVEEVV